MQSRANLMTPRATAALRAAGCEEVWLGVESGSQRILDAMEKGTEVEEVRGDPEPARAGDPQRLVHPARIPRRGVGRHPRTRDLVRDERPDDVGVSVSYPLPGTKFFDMVRDELGARTNWVDSDELAMLFQGTYQTGFYRQVRELLHAEVRGPAGTGARAELDAVEELARAESLHRSPLRPCAARVCEARRSRADRARGARGGCGAGRPRGPDALAVRVPGVPARLRGVPGGAACEVHGAFALRDGVWRLLAAERAERYERFLREYRRPPLRRTG